MVFLWFSITVSHNHHDFFRWNRAFGYCDFDATTWAEQISRCCQMLKTPAVLRWSGVYNKHGTRLVQQFHQPKKTKKKQI